MKFRLGMIINKLCFTTERPKGRLSTFLRRYYSEIPDKFEYLAFGNRGNSSFVTDAAFSGPISNLQDLIDILIVIAVTGLLAYLLLR